MREGESTVLDNSCPISISNLWSCSQHDLRKVPLLRVGGLGGQMQTGRVPDYLGRGDDNRMLCIPHLSLMNRMGVRAEHFADATAPLSGLSCR